MIIKQLSIFVENRRGRLAEVTEALGAAGVDIRALSIADTSDFGILRLIVDRPEEAVVTLQEAGVTVCLTDVIAVGIEDTPGAFAGVVRMLSDAGIEIEYMYAFVSRSANRASMIFRVEEPDAACRLLREKGIHLLQKDEIAG